MSGVQACPNCGERVEWDRTHEPNAWRHAFDSRWCESVAGESPVYPAGATNPTRRVST